MPPAKKLYLSLLALALLTAASGFSQSISILSGNGQITQQNFIAGEPLTVVVRTVGGLPAVAVFVNWTITAGNGIVTQTTSFTNENGEASTNFLGPSLFSGVSFSSTTVNAQAQGIAGSVDFTVITAGGDFSTGTLVAVQVTDPSLPVTESIVG
ncbi:MAG: hypothetical protein ACRD96_03580, partial [Bryobacteraceae bacterium]